MFSGSARRPAIPIVWPARPSGSMWRGRIPRPASGGAMTPATAMLIARPAARSGGRHRPSAVSPPIPTDYTMKVAMWGMGGGLLARLWRAGRCPVRLGRGDYRQDRLFATGPARRIVGQHGRSRSVGPAERRSAGGPPSDRRVPRGARLIAALRASRRCKRRSEYDRRRHVW